jgi:hypothetical protein
MVDGGAEIDAGSSEDAGVDPPRDGGSGVDGSADDAGIRDAGVRDGGMRDGGTVVAAGHLFLSEVAPQPAGGEFVEILNPTRATISLADVYLSDNAYYWEIATGVDWRGDPSSDFVVRFPAGASIAPGAVVTVTASDDFEVTYGVCPNYRIPRSGALPLVCGGRTVPDMIVPAHGSTASRIGTTLSNDREMVVLFRWNGVSATVTDLDYLTWGADVTEFTRVDKSFVPGYRADTPPSLQSPASASGLTQSMSRCSGEVGEITTGGNGETGHDETSEDLSVSFVRVTHSPGRANVCP